MTRLRIATGRTFRSMSVRNFRLYFFGQIVSASGTWMQSVAQAWLVLRLTHSGVALGITAALQFSPTLLGGAWAGVMADRVDKRRLLVITSAAAAVLASALGLVVALGVVQLWMVYGLALLLGCVTALDNPARRAFVVEMVGPQYLANATGLSSAVFTAARVVGPAIAGLLIAGVGLAWCFFLNAGSFGAVIVAFALMRRAELFTVAPTPRAKGQLREGLRYVWSTPELLLPLAMVAVIGTLAFNFQVVLPLLAHRTFHQGAAQFGSLYSFMSLGSVTGALVAAHHARPDRRILVGSAFTFGVFMMAAAFAPTLPILMVLLVPTGLAGMGFLTMANSALQIHAAPQMRGRVGALFAVAFIGSTPIGGPIVGWVSEQFGPRAGLALGGVATIATALVAAGSVRASRAVEPEPVTSLFEAAA